jgi:hypothetical protein
MEKNQGLFDCVFQKDSIAKGSIKYLKQYLRHPKYF